MNVALAIIASVILGSAATALTLNNIVRSVLLLAGSWFGIAAFYLWAGAEFAAFAQAIVYGGAVSMVALFAVLLTRRTHAEVSVAPPPPGRVVGALLAGGATAGILAASIVRTPFEAASEEAPSLPVRRIGALLMGPHAASLLVAGLLLTVALLGAVAIAASVTDEARRAGGTAGIAFRDTETGGSS